MTNCPNCSSNDVFQSGPNSFRCNRCQTQFTVSPPPNYQAPPPFNNPQAAYMPQSGKDKLTTALLAFFLGGFGIQYFYLGKNSAGLLMILFTVLSCGIVSGVISLITFIKCLVQTQQEFEQNYVFTTSTFPI